MVARRAGDFRQRFVPHVAKCADVKRGEVTHHHASHLDEVESARIYDFPHCLPVVKPGNSLSSQMNMRQAWGVPEPGRPRRYVQIFC